MGAVPDPLPSIEPVARELGIARSTAYLWAEAGRLPVVRRAGRLYVPRAALDAFLRAEAKAALANLDDQGSGDA